MRPRVNARRYPWIAAALTLIAAGSCNAEAFRFSSVNYHYSVSFPTGWVQIPNPEIAKLKVRLPSQAQHLIYDAAFQRGNGGKWFEWPYVIVQVIPPERTNLRRLPTEAEFQQVVRDLAGGRAISKVKEIIDTVKSTTDKTYLNSFLQSLAAPTVQVDIANRKYQFLISGKDPAGAMNLFTVGTFMPDGSIVQVNAYTNLNAFPEDVKAFAGISRSVRHSDAASPQNTSSLSQSTVPAALPAPDILAGGFLSPGSKPADWKDRKSAFSHWLDAFLIVQPHPDPKIQAFVTRARVGDADAFALLAFGAWNGEAGFRKNQLEGKLALLRALSEGSVEAAWFIARTFVINAQSGTASDQIDSVQAALQWYGIAAGLGDSRSNTDAMDLIAKASAGDDKARQYLIGFYNSGLEHSHEYKRK